MEVKTANGIYEIIKPAGSVGKDSIMIIAGLQPKSKEVDEDGSPLLSTKDEERIFSGFDKWVTIVLPRIIKSSPFDDEVMNENPSLAKDFDDDKKRADALKRFGELVYNMIPGEDQWIIFQHVVASANGGATAKKFQ